MDSNDRAALDAVAERIRARQPEARIRAFGSRVVGGASPESDLDVCVVLEQLNPATRQWVSDVAWEVGLERNLHISTVVFTTDQFERGSWSLSPLVVAIREAGVAA